MKRLILTIILGILLINLPGCVHYRTHRPWHSREVVVVTSPRRPHIPPPPPRYPHGRHAPKPIPRHYPHRH